MSQKTPPIQRAAPPPDPAGHAHDARTAEALCAIAQCAQDASAAIWWAGMGEALVARESRWRGGAS